MQVSYNKYKGSLCIICQNPFFCTYAPVTEIWYTLITTEIVFTVKSNSFLHFLLISGLWLLSVALYGKRNKLIMTNWQTIQWKWIIHCNKLHMTKLLQSFVLICIYSWFSGHWVQSSLISVTNSQNQGLLLCCCI